MCLISVISSRDCRCMSYVKCLTKAKILILKYCTHAHNVLRAFCR